MYKPIIKMNTKTVNKLRSIAKDSGLRGYYMLKKADLISLLSEQSAKKMPMQPPRTNGGKSPVPHVNIIPSPQEMDEFKKEEMKKSRPVVKSKLNDWYDWLVDYVPNPIKNTINKAYLRVKKVY